MFYTFIFYCNCISIHFSPYKMKVKEKEIVERCEAPEIVGSNLTLYKPYPNQMAGPCLCKFLYVSIMLVNCKSSKKVTFIFYNHLLILILSQLPKERDDNYT